MNKGSKIVLQNRDLHALRELSVARVADGNQIRIFAGFGSVSRTNRRLLKLVRAGLLRRFFLGTVAGGAKAVYSLSEKGARLAEVPYRALRRTKDQVLVADFSVAHQLIVTELYCALKYCEVPLPSVKFHRWVSFQEPLSPGLRLIPDGYLEFQTPGKTVASFLEVDLGHERLKVWQQKIRNYIELALSGTFERQFGVNRFRTLVVAHSSARALSIRKVAASVTDKIFWFSNLEDIRSHGVFGPIWIRPKQDIAQPFFRETA
jgi:Replication-relaxation